ncbi:MAG: DNA-binding protein [Francisellaceae bacterium]|nr:DNA-binding protein [Francisellaceae bacterium]
MKNYVKHLDGVTMAKKSQNPVKKQRAAVEGNVKTKKMAKANKTKNSLAKLANFTKEKQTRIQILQTIADTAELSKVQVKNVFMVLSELLKGHMKKKGSGEFTIPMSGIKVRRIKKKATKARTMVSPLTNKEVVIPAKPARTGIKVTALKSLKVAISE